MPSIHEVELENLLSLLSSEGWGTCDLYFVGDVGGTHARLGFGKMDVTHYSSSDVLESPITIFSPKDDFVQGNVHIVYIHFLLDQGSIRQLLHFLDAILKRVNESITRRIIASVISVPGPVSAESVAGPFNNLTGMINLNEFPSSLFPPQRSALLNDVQAGAYGVLTISGALSHHYSKYFKLMWGRKERSSQHLHGKCTHGTPYNKEDHEKTTELHVNTETNHSMSSMLELKQALVPKCPLAQSYCLVIAPGTGLGSALVVCNSSTHFYQVLPLEFGCTCVSSFVMDEQTHMGIIPRPCLKEFAHFLKCKHWEMKVEDLVCSNSLIYHYIREVDLDLNKSCLSGKDMVLSDDLKVACSPEYIIDLAKAGDPAARRALLTIYTYLFKCCSDAIMSFLPLNCVLIGDNVVKNSFLIDDSECEKILYDALHAHPMSKHGFMSRTSFFRQSKTLNLNLLGGLGFGIRLGNSFGQKWNFVKPKLQEG